MKIIKNGYTLVELMVVIAIFAIIALIASETIILTLRGTTKADSISKVRQNVDYAMGAMQRQLRGAREITSTCDNTPKPSISFTDQYNNPVTFSCVGVNSSNQPSSIASSSSNLTSSNITLSACSFSCSPEKNGAPAFVTISIIANDLSSQNTPITDTTQVTLRSY